MLGEGGAGGAEGSDRGGAGPPRLGATRRGGKWGDLGVIWTILPTRRRGRFPWCDATIEAAVGGSFRQNAVSHGRACPRERRGVRARIPIGPGGGGGRCQGESRGGESGRRGGDGGRAGGRRADTRAPRTRPRPIPSHCPARPAIEACYTAPLTSGGRRARGATVATGLPARSGASPGVRSAWGRRQAVGPGSPAPIAPRLSHRWARLSAAPTAACPHRSATSIVPSHTEETRRWP